MNNEKREERLNSLLKKATRIKNFIEAGYCNRWRHGKSAIKMAKTELRNCVGAIEYHAPLVGFTEDEIKLSTYDFKELLK